MQKLCDSSAFAIALICLAAMLSQTSVSAQLVVDGIIPTLPEPAPQEFPGGLYKAAGASEFPFSDTMSGGLVKLNAGGMREGHWHNPNEWAYVLNGTCRATLVNQGAEHMVESSFNEGDIWYFESNLPHVILGAGDAGCAYLVAYDQGDFDDRLDSQGLSGWFTQAPAGIAAQAVGLPNTTLVTSNLVNDTNNFMPQGNLTELIAGDTTPSPVLAATSAPLSCQVNSVTHRYPFGVAGYEEVHTDGGVVRTADQEYFTASTQMSGSLVHFEPGALRQMHWHTNEAEWQFVINGTLQTQLYFGPGSLVGVNTLGPNDFGFIPKGVGHWIKNPDPVNEAWAILVFNNGTFTNVEIGDWIGNYPIAYTALSLNTSMDFVEQFNFSRAGMVGQGPGSRPNVNYTLSGTE